MFEIIMLIVILVIVFKMLEVVKDNNKLDYQNNIIRKEINSKVLENTKLIKNNNKILNKEITSLNEKIDALNKQNVELADRLNHSILNHQIIEGSEITYGDKLKELGL